MIFCITIFNEKNNLCVPANFLLNKKRKSIKTFFAKHCFVKKVLIFDQTTSAFFVLFTFSKIPFNQIFKKIKMSN